MEKLPCGTPSSADTRVWPCLKAAKKLDRYRWKLSFGFSSSLLSCLSRFLSDSECHSSSWDSLCKSWKARENISKNTASKWKIEARIFYRAKLMVMCCAVGEARLEQTDTRTQGWMDGLPSAMAKIPFFLVQWYHWGNIEYLQFSAKARYQVQLTGKNMKQIFHHNFIPQKMEKRWAKSGFSILFWNIILHKTSHSAHSLLHDNSATPWTYTWGYDQLVRVPCLERRSSSVNVSYTCNDQTEQNNKICNWNILKIVVSCVCLCSVSMFCR